ncbi:ATP-binding protein [Oligoflexaceae bacterium]|nr:ATP-binding protein [Oligoflexaceae bacterium]
MAILLGGVGIGVYRYVEHNLYQSVDAALLTSAKSIRDTRFTKGFNSPQMEEFLEEFLGERFIKPYAQLVDLSGIVSLKTPSMRVNLPVTPQAVERAAKGLATFETFVLRGHSKIRQVTVPVIKRDRFSRELVQIGAPLDSTFQTLRSISLMLWVALPVGLFLSVLFGYILTSRSLKPVRQLTLAASKLGANEVTARIPLPQAKDEIRELTSKFNDMTDRLDDAFNRLRRFAGDVSHELRTPLTVLRGEAEFSLRKDRSPEEYREAMQTIARESIHMTDIVEELLLLARAQGKAIRVHWEKIKVGEMVAEVKSSVEHLAKKKEIEIVTSIRDPDAQMIGSQGYIVLVLKNLLQNAVKHSSPKGRVFISVSQNGIHTYFTVKDEGEGIAESAVPYIFDAFYRADTARNRSAGGAGIGLSLAQALVKLHEGDIWVESKESEGASFTFKIPLDPKGKLDLDETGTVKDGSSRAIIAGLRPKLS